MRLTTNKQLRVWHIHSRHHHAAVVVELPAPDAKTKRPNLHLVKLPLPDAPFVAQIESILKAAEDDLASAAGRFIEVGRMLRERKEAGKLDGSIPHGQWVPWLKSKFPQRSYNRLGEYMRVAEAMEDTDTKTRMSGFLPQGIDAVLDEVRRLKRAAKPKPPPLTEDVNGGRLRVLVGDCREKIRELDDGSLHCCVTSVPYYRQRIYDVPNLVWDCNDPTCEHVWEMHPDKIHGHMAFEWGSCRNCGAWLGQLGLEPTPELYIQHLVQIFREVRRVLKKTGTLFINIGDKIDDGRLLWIPARLAIALDADGWIGRNEIIWQKGEGECENVTNRFARNHEQVLFFTKSEKYEFDIEAIKEPAKYAHDSRGESRIAYNGKYNANNGRGQKSTFYGVKSGTRIKRDVWCIPKSSTDIDHVAVMPEKLVEPMVLAGCPKGGTVLDPFAGVCTTGLVANALGRKAILIEANPEYAALGKERIEKELAAYTAKSNSEDAWGNSTSEDDELEAAE